MRRNESGKAMGVGSVSTRTRSQEWGKQDATDPASSEILIYN